MGEKGDLDVVSSTQRAEAWKRCTLVLLKQLLSLAHHFAESCAKRKLGRSCFRHLSVRFG